MSVAAAGGGMGGSDDDNGGGERKKWKGISKIPDSPPSIDEDTDHDDNGKEGESKAKLRRSMYNLRSRSSCPGKPKAYKSLTEILGTLDSKEHQITKRGKNPKRLAKKGNPIAKRRKQLQGGATSSMPANVPDEDEDEDEDGDEDDNKKGSGAKNLDEDGK